MFVILNMTTKHTKLNFSNMLKEDKPQQEDNLPELFFKQYQEQEEQEKQELDRLVKESDLFFDCSCLVQ